MTTHTSYRLGLDLGTNSIGWSAVKLDADNQPCDIVDAGVRVLSPNDEAGRDPQSKTSLAANRRAARAMRRRRDRFLRRKKRLMETLIAAELMPADAIERKQLETIDPYELRAQTLDTPLPPHHLGRAIFHLNQRRGFKSNRIADEGDAEDGAVKAGVAALKEALAVEGARTLGEFLAIRHRKREPVRFRPTSQGASVLYDFYPSRDMIEYELDAIWSAQKPYHSQLTSELLKRLKRIIIEQRPLKKPLVGRCTFRPEEKRAPRALPLFQRFRILDDAARLEIERPGHPARKLTIQERDSLLSLLLSQASIVSFEKLRSALKLPDDARFNLERGGRKGLQPDMTAAVLAKGGGKASFGKRWRSFPIQRQTEIVEKLLNEEREGSLIDWLMEECGLSETEAENASNARLPQGHCHLGRSMLADLVSIMESEYEEDGIDPQTGEIYPRPLTYDEAVRRVGLHHSDFRNHKLLSRLPYYGEVMERHVIPNPGAPTSSQEYIGRVPNPTVHIALNQTRAVVNALIDAYGPPSQIVIELARELKQNKKQKEEITRKNRENEAANERRRQKLQELGFANTAGNRLLLRLFEELPADERVCVYTGTPISCAMLFDGSVDIDHILPLSKTLDDSFTNKVLCNRAANRQKGNRSPSEAWSDSELQNICERAERLFKYKAWRFAPDAMERFEKERDFIARHLTDSQHMARLAKAYLGHVCDPDKVWATPGRLTAMLRRMWGLDSLLTDHNRLGGDAAPVKNRNDHRHHAIDAFVVACTDRGLLKRVSTASGRAEELDLDRWAVRGEFPEPFEGYREALRNLLETMIISHKPDHGLPPYVPANSNATSGQLHEETAYGLVAAEISGQRFNLVTRKALIALNENDINKVRDEALRVSLQMLSEDTKRNNEKLSDALIRFGEKTGIRRVRVLKTKKPVVKITHGNGMFEKAYIPGDNQYLEIFVTDTGDWTGEAVSVFEANHPRRNIMTNIVSPSLRLVMRVHKGDLIQADFGEGLQVYRVVRLEPSARRLRLVRHSDAGNYEARHNDALDSFRWIFATYSKLKDAKAQLVRVDPIGRIRTVGMSQ